MDIRITKLNTPGAYVHRATLRTDNIFFRHDTAGNANDAATGLILDIGRFKTEAIAAISKHLREETK